MTYWRVRAARTLLAPLAGALVLVAAPVPGADAATSLTGVKVRKITHTSFKVRLDSLGPGWKYTLYASTNKPDLYADNLANAPYHAARKRPVLTLDNLRYKTKPYYWRVQATKRGSHHTGDLLSLGLRPKAPTGLTASHVDSQGLSLTWKGGRSNGFQVQQATGAGFSTDVKKYRLRGTGRQFTPFGLAQGTAYSFRVRASNFGTKSAWSSGVAATAIATEQQIRVGQFNIHSETATNNDVPPWKDRRDAVVASVNQGGPPDILAISEGDGWIAGKCSPRQVDDLASRLGSDWVVAHTDPIPCKEPNWKRTGTYIIYNSSLYRAVGAVGHWKVSTSGNSAANFAAYQELVNVASGARMLFVSVHLQKGNSLAQDKEREAETENMLSDVAALNLDLPVIYAGDFNSQDQRAYDGPGKVIRKAHIADAWFVAQHRVRPSYNSANAYQRKPPRTWTSIDHLCGSPGVALKTWEQIMKIKNGAYVGVIPSDHNMVVADVTYPY